jgi:hypothetical protein
MSLQETRIEPPHRHTKQERVGSELSMRPGAFMQVDCVTCKWIRWSASIPLILLLSAGGFLVLAQVAVVHDNAPAVILDLYLATWSYVLAVAGVALLSGWWLWKWLHQRTHVLRPC